MPDIPSERFERSGCAVSLDFIAWARILILIKIKIYASGEEAADQSFGMQAHLNTGGGV
jgi:hypothetical protein